MVEYKVKHIYADSLVVEDGVLYYDSVGIDWFLTPFGAAASQGVGLKISYSLEGGV